MPPRTRLRTPALDDLARQLRYAPREALDRHIAAAEQLAGELEAGKAYPEDWFIFRLTGYRPEIDEPSSLVGEALLGDLSALVERLTVAAGRTPKDAGAGALDLDALSARWGVGAKSIERYRRRGLIAHRVIDEAGVERLYFPIANVEAFEAREGERLRTAADFSRIDTRLEATLVRRAARYHTSLGWSLNQAAARLAERFGRSHEGVRKLLRRHDERAVERGEAPVFDESDPPSARERAVWARAVRRGIEPSLIADRTARTRPSVIRAINIERGARLRALDLTGPTLATFPREDAREVLLADPRVRTGLDVTGPRTLGKLVTTAREHIVVPAPDEAARAVAYHFLRFDAARLIASLEPSAPKARALDDAETALRWAGRLKAMLVRPHLRLILTSLESEGVSPETHGTSGLRRLVLEGVGVLAGVVDRFDASRGGRLAAACSIAMGRHVSAWKRAHESAPAAAGRATRRFRPEAPTPDWTRLVAPWQAWLEPDPRLAPVLDRLDERDRVVLSRRFALDGEPPETLSDLAERLGTTRVHAARYEREAVRAGLALARQAFSPGSTSDRRR
ncbi:MAG: sigma factor-like helix-turn-helix DNA-binding protein [Phycisphaerales bacterium]